MTTVITGANGKYGRLVIDALLRRGVPAGELIATGRDVTKLDDIAERGLTVRHADYDDPASLRTAFDGADQLLLVSATDAGSRARQHRNAITAAKEAGVRRIVYTSMANAGTATTILGGEHRGTEADLAASGLTSTVLRNGWYIENYTDQLATYLEYGIAGAAKDGRVSAATRRDYAEAAAVVLTTDGHDGAVYELGGEAFTLSELAKTVSDISGRKVEYTDLPPEAFEQVLVGAGVPQPFAAVLVDADRGLSLGELFVEGHDLEKLLGRPVTPLADAVKDALKALPATR